MPKKSKGSGQMKRANGNNDKHVAPKKKTPVMKPPSSVRGRTALAKKKTTKRSRNA